MANARLDALIVPPSDPALRLLHGDMRWITQVGGIDGAPVAAVFPRMGEPIAIAQGAAQWLECQPWLSDLREAASDFAGATRVVLREVSLRQRRVGVARLGDPSGAWDTGPSDGFLRSLAAGFPTVDWIDFSAPLDALRAVKSAEEIAFLERSAAILDGAFTQAAITVRPGVPGSEPLGALIEAICRAGSDLPPPPRWAMPPKLADLEPRTSPKPIAPGASFLVEAQAAWGGYHAWGAQTFAAGSPDASDRELMQILAAMWHTALDCLAPGRAPHAAYAEMLTAMRREAHQSAGASEVKWRLTLRGCGLGSDLPREPLPRESTDEPLLAPGWCLAIGLTANRDGKQLIWGDSVVVSATGARRLGRRESNIALNDPSG